MADQVHQLEWPHAEATGIAHHRVDSGSIGRLLAQQTPAFRVERTGYTVDDEARSGTCVYRILAPRCGRIEYRLRDRCIGCQTADHFHQRHQRYGIKEVHPHQSLRQLQSRRNGCDGNRRGIGSEDAGVTHHAFQFGKQRTFNLQIFHNGLYHQPCVRHIVQVQCRVDAGYRSRTFHCAQTFFLHQFVQRSGDIGHGFGDGFGAVVVQPHGVASNGGHLRDACAHGARTDNSDSAASIQSCHAYSPLNCGARFSMNAATPSR